MVVSRIGATRRKSKPTSKGLASSSAGSGARPGIEAAARRPPAWLAAAVLGTALAACESIIGPPLVVGSGDVRVATRDVAAFSQIATRSLWEVEIEIGPVPSVHLEADANILEVARTDVDDGTLIVDTPDVRISRPTRMRATVTVPQVTALYASDQTTIRVSSPLRQPSIALTAADRATVDIASLRVDRLTVTVRDAGELRAAGTAAVLSVSAGGDGAAHLSELAAERATVNLAGSAAVALQVRTAIAGTVTDAAELRLRGSPPDQRVAAGDGATFVRE